MLDPWLPYVFCAFVVGSIPFGKLLGKRVAGIDITKHGSGNIGATNVARSLGLGWGLLTLLLDALKGWVPVLAFVHWGRPDDAFLFNNPSWVGLWAILGHQFSPFQRLRGGKGVATALGVYFLVSPLSCVLGLLLFLFLVSRWGFVSLGSILAAWSIPGVLAVAGAPWATVLWALVVAGLISVKHRDNVRRLLTGQEPRWRKVPPQESRSKSRSNSSSE